MKCAECKVSLPDEYKYCPLCSDTPSDIPSDVFNVKTAEYPLVYKKRKLRKNKKEPDFCMEKIKAYFNF